MSTDPSHTVWEDEEAAREAALAATADLDEPDPTLLDVADEQA